MKAFCLLLTCLLFDLVLVSGQAMFKFQYNLPYEKGVAAVSSFYFQYDDGSGFMRSRFRLPGESQDVLLEMELEEEDLFINENTIDNKRRYVKAINPQVLEGDAKLSVLTPVFLFELDRVSKVMLPTKVLINQVGGQRVDVPEANFNYVSLQAADLKPQMLSAYFYEDDDFMKNIFDVATRNSTPLPKGVAMHLILVANTLEPVIGTSCKMDMEKVQSMFKQIAEYGGMPFKTYSISGKRYSKLALQTLVKKVKVGRKDILIFYYSGHGFRTTKTKSQFPNMDLRSRETQDYLKESLSIKEVYDSLKNKNARLTLVFGDCCNSYVDAPRSQGSTPLTPKSSVFPMSRENLAALFFNENKMAVLATAADSSEMASSNNAFGGFFTHYLKSATLSNCGIIKLNPTWYRILDDAQGQTVKKAKRTYCNKPFIAANVCNQHPIYVVE